MKLEENVMKRVTFGALGILLAAVQAPIAAQSGGPPTLATDVTAAEVQKVVSAPGGGDREIKIVDNGSYNIGIAVLRRGATKPGATFGAINHTKVTEVYYVVSGSGTLLTGGEVSDVKPLAADNEIVTTIVGPSNNATFVKPAQTRKIGPGDIVVIPVGVYHGFSDIPDHIEYVSMRPDLEKVLPAGYINPALKK